MFYNEHKVSLQELNVTQALADALAVSVGVYGLVTSSYRPEPLGGFGVGSASDRGPRHTGHKPIGNILGKLLRLPGFNEGNRPTLPNHTGHSPDDSLRRLIRYIFGTSFEELAYDIAYGHTWDKDGRQFEWGRLGINDRDKLAERIYDILTSPVATKVRGDTTIYLGFDGTIVFDNPIDPDGGTAFNPNIQQGRDTASREVFNDLEGVEQ
jgi:hypothetical protein